VLTISGEEAQKVRDSIEKMEEEMEKSEPIQKLQRVAAAVRVWRAGMAEELKKRGFENVADVTDAKVLAEILDAAGPMPDIENI
jgi:predicted DsbA family dithiol-disulfide isomerase